MSRYIIRTTHNLSYAGELCVQNEQYSLLLINKESGLTVYFPDSEITQMIEIEKGQCSYNQSINLIRNTNNRGLFCSIAMHHRTVLLGEITGSARCDDKSFVMLKPSDKSGIEMLVEKNEIDFVLSMSGQKLNVDDLIFGDKEVLKK